jgi:hypothetical protein
MHLPFLNYIFLLAGKSNLIRKLQRFNGFFPFCATCSKPAADAKAVLPIFLCRMRLAVTGGLIDFST